MELTTLDWIIVGIFFLIVLTIGLVASRTAGKDMNQFFLGGRGMPWWLLGISMVACTFSADTPNLVTGMVREDGVAKNWAWWAFLITGMVTVFIYAKLWRRSKVLTDLEFYEIRYSGKVAGFLRGFRAIYLGLFFNVLIMGSVTLAAIKIGAVMLGLQPWESVLYGSIAVVVYSVLGGLKGVIWADFFQYSIALFGAVYAAFVAVSQPEIGGIGNLLTHPAVSDKLDFLPQLADPAVFLPLLIIPIAVQWWSVWYPGAEPGGGGYVAQRMLAAKNEKNAVGATLLFNFMHYAIRPWPWIIVALASMVIYPDLASIKADFPQITDTYLKNDIAYPAMMGKLTSGWLGLVVASLIAAYMSTIGTHLNWGASYLVNDFYKRFVKIKASQRHYILMARILTVVLMALAGLVSLTFLDNATQAFDILLLSGAGTGAIYLLRWFWWRINAWTELVSMIVATITAIVMVFAIEDGSLATASLDHNTVRLLLTIFITTVSWLLTTYLARPENLSTLRSFYQLTQPGGPGWRRVLRKARKEGIELDNEPGKAWEMPVQILCVFVGAMAIYAALFSIGSFVYGRLAWGIGLLLFAAAGTWLLFRLFGKLGALQD
jgi:Na+/proline symporter